MPDRLYAESDFESETMEGEDSGRIEPGTLAAAGTHRVLGRNLGAWSDFEGVAAADLEAVRAALAPVEAEGVDVQVSAIETLIG